MKIHLKAITPKGKIIKGSVKANILAASQRVGERIKSDFIRTTSTWSHRVVFVSNLTSADGGSIEVYTNDKIYGFVDEGTRPHVIAPKSKKLLKFSSGYVAKTTPGVIGSGPGGSRGYPVFAKAVSHPGTVGRNFSVVIAKKFDPIFAAAIDAAIKKSVRS